MLLLFSLFQPAWVLGTVGLSISKIVENMEIGHNVMHGQWDWMRDPKIHSTTWEWDAASPSEMWNSDNELHHTYTNVYDTSRFARNVADAWLYRDRLARAGVVLVFCADGLIAGTSHVRDRGPPTVADAAYIRRLSRNVGRATSRSGACSLILEAMHRSGSPV